MRMKRHRHLRYLSKSVPKKLFLSNLMEPIQIIQEKSIRLHPYSTMLVKNGQTNELAASILIKVKFVRNDCYVNRIYCLLLQILHKSHFRDDNELKVGLVSLFLEMFDPYLHEEGILKRRFFEIHP